MPGKEEIDLDGYQYDEMWDTYRKRLSFNETTFSNSISSPHNCWSDRDYDIAWDDSWDFGSSVSSQPESESEIEIWSIYLPDEDFLYEAVFFKDPGYDSSSYELELGPDEKYLLEDTNLLSESSQQILARPLEYFAMCEEEHLGTPEYFCPTLQVSQLSSQVKPTSLPVAGFELFDSVELILQLLEGMPSLQLENVQLCPNSNVTVHPERLLPDIYPILHPAPNLWFPPMLMTQKMEEILNMQLPSQWSALSLNQNNSPWLNKQNDMTSNMRSTNTSDLHWNWGTNLKPTQRVEQPLRPVVSPPSASIYCISANGPNIIWIKSGELCTGGHASYVNLIGDLWRPMVQDEVAQVFDPGGFSK